MLYKRKSKEILSERFIGQNDVNPQSPETKRKSLDLNTQPLRSNDFRSRQKEFTDAHNIILHKYVVKLLSPPYLQLKQGVSYEI